VEVVAQGGRVRLAEGAVMATVDTRLPDQPQQARYPSILNSSGSAVALNKPPSFFYTFFLLT